MRNVKIAIVGAGTWGEAHASIYREHPVAEVAAICDLDSARAERLAKAFGISSVYTDYAKMLAECDCEAVAIVTPDFLHRDIAIACAKAGKHMLIEKPLATTRRDVYDMVEAIESSGVRAMVDLHNRWSPPFNSVKRILSSGRLGKPVSSYFRLNDTIFVPTEYLSWAERSSVLWFLGSHSLDTLRWLVDDEIVEIYAVKHEGVLKNLGVDVPDVYQSTLKFRKGSIAQMENGWVTPEGNPSINDIKSNIVCEKGKIDIDASNHNLVQVTDDKRMDTVDVLVRNSVFDSCKGFAYESIRSFVDCLASGADFHVSIKDSANTSLAILSIIESAEKGIPVRPEVI